MIRLCTTVFRQATNDPKSPPVTGRIGSECTSDDNPPGIETTPGFDGFGGLLYLFRNHVNWKMYETFKRFMNSLIFMGSY